MRAQSVKRSEVSLHPCRFENQDLVWFEQVNLEKYTTIKLGNIGDLVEVKSIDALKELLTKIKEQKFNFRIVGWGANQVLHTTDKTLFIKLDFHFDKSYLQKLQDRYVLPASVGLNQLTATAIKHGLKGWEVFTGIPASLGGAICMNAGTSLGEIGSLIEEVQVLKTNGDIYTHKVGRESFSYRHNKFLKTDEIIIGATIKHLGIDKSIGQTIKEYLQYRKNTQPLGSKNCGSVFKNNPNFRAGQTIDSLGLKGFGNGEISVSMKHANFIENHAGAKSEDFLELVDCLKEEIERCSGQKFELEVKIY